ncbi:MAG: c-type cytochrome [Planctomycetes bacterium]|nr:c-type cytochrome [Planctomycetota bacterium]
MNARRTVLALAVLALASSCFHFRRWRVPDDATAEVIYVRAACADCHGEDRWGTERAPGLRELEAHWTVESLAAYVAAPGENRDARLDALDAEYETDMPGSAFLSLAQRTRLARWLLGYE